MRDYFALQVKGKELFPAVIICVLTGWLYVGYDFLSAWWFGQEQAGEIEVNGRLFTSWGIDLAVSGIYGIVSCLSIFFILRRMVDSLSCGEERFETDYRLRDFSFLVIKGILLSLITFGIYWPWFYAAMLRYFARNTLYKYNYFDFGGRGMALFGLITLLVILPVGILVLSMPYFPLSALFMPHGTTSMLLFWSSLITILVVVGCVAMMFMAVRWTIDFSWNDRRIVLKASVVGGIAFLLGQCILCVLTFGFYLPMMQLRAYRYFVNRTVIGHDQVEKRFGFTLDTWSDYGFMLGQMLLVLVTLGIYTPWAIARVSSRLISRTFVEPVEEGIAMPA